MAAALFRPATRPGRGAAANRTNRLAGAFLPAPTLVSPAATCPATSPSRLVKGEIAARTALAPKTVTAHVEHIRNRLGVRSRAPIGVRAAGRGLSQNAG